MTLKQRQQAALAKLIALSPATLVYNGQTITVYKTPSVRKAMNLNEYSMQFNIDDFYIIADADDVASWNVEELRTSRVTVDGVTYQIGQTLTTFPGGLKVYLKAVS
jgi:outer membrane lipoprotein-sorting protein